MNAKSKSPNWRDNMIPTRKRRIIGLEIVTILMLIFMMGSIIVLSGCAGHTGRTNIESTDKAPIIKGKVNVYLFWQNGCPHCALEKPFLKNLSKEYPVNVYLFEIGDKKNLNLWMDFCKLYNEKPLGVPMTFIGDKHFVGFDKGDGLIGNEIESQIKDCINNGCVEKAYYLRGDINNSDFEVYSSLVINLSGMPSNTSNNSEAGEEPCNSKNETVCAPSDSSTNNSIKESTLTSLTEKIPAEKTSGKQNRTEENQTKEVIIPLIGKVNVSNISLPLFTLAIAGLDGFNPCAMWVLSFLLTLLIYSKSKKKMLFIGLTFVITSGAIYFLFMTAWLNFFLFVGYVNIIRILLGVIAVLMGIINLKDSFWFKKGISLTIPEKAKPKLFKRMRTVVKESQESDRIPASAFIGTVALAVTANLIELACTAGFPAIYTRILTLRRLSLLSYYSYLVLYNFIYVIPLFMIVMIFSLTLGAHKFTDKSGRILKFIGGTLMLLLGVLLIYKPQLLIFK